jgi:hypothetical protein
MRDPRGILSQAQQGVAPSGWTVFTKWVRLEVHRGSAMRPWVDLSVPGCLSGVSGSGLGGRSGRRR